MQYEVKETCNLLNENGTLTQPGFCKKMNFTYNRNAVKSFPLKLKEWDFYQFQKDHYVLQLTIGHLSYIAQACVTLFHLDNNERYSTGIMVPLTIPSLSHSPEEESLSEFSTKDFHISFQVSNEKRVLHFKGTDKNYGDVEISLTIDNDPLNEKMVIATPFSKPNQFYLNYKENYYHADGMVRFGDVTVDFTNSTGLLDWGRGVWPYSHQWYWGSVTSFIDDVPFGLNIGWGFGDTSHATEDMYFYNKKAYKIEGLNHVWNDNDLLKPLEFFDAQGKFQCTFTPLYNNHTENKFVVVDTECDQVFGFFRGSIETEDGIKHFTNVLGFIEHANNHW